jgi:hypothetical protein
MAAYLIVRAAVPENERKAFDVWYADEHLPDALKAFQAARAWRGWSQVEPQLHYAFYEFPTLAAVQAVMASGAIKELVAEFDRVWGTRVNRTREVLEVAQVLPG